MLHELSLPAVRTGQRADEGLLARRAQMAGLAASQIVDPAPRLHEANIAGIPVVEAVPAASTGFLLYAHGGGFRMGDAATWRGFASRLATASGLTVVVPDYGLAPENPFPNGLHDLAAVHHALQQATAGLPYFLGGDSAGGGLACALTHAIVAAGQPAPSGLVLFSPWLDLTVVADSYDRCRQADVAFTRETALECAAQYLQGYSGDDPLASPLAGNVSRFPPTWIGVGGREVLLDDSLALARKLIAAGVAVDLRFEPAMLHVWPMLMPDAPETAAAFAAAGACLRRAVESAHQSY